MKALLVWPLEIIAGVLMLVGVSGVLAGLMVGYLVDRLEGR